MTRVYGFNENGQCLNIAQIFRTLQLGFYKFLY